MEKLTLNEIIAATGGSPFNIDINSDIEVLGVSIDTRTIDLGELFIPIVGERFDGHDFLKAALDKGAALVLSDRAVNIPHIRVGDTTQAFLDLAEYYMSKRKAKVVAITGSVGKTTTKELISAVLMQRFSVLKSEGNLNNQTGVPKTAFRVDDTHEVAVMEMGTNHFGEIDRIAKVGKPDICVFTNIGDAHIEFLGSKEGVLKAKSEMLPHMKAGGHIIISGDDPLLMRLSESYSGVLSCGFGEHCLYRAMDEKPLGLFGTEFTVSYRNVKTRVRLTLPGRHMVINALIAFAVGDCLKMSPEEIAEGLLCYEPITGRLYIEEAGELTVINDAYNANPSSVKASLSTLLYAESRRVAILGDMMELGSDAPRYHEEIGRYAMELGIDKILCVGELSKYTAKAAKGIHFSSQDELIASLKEHIRPNDTVLVKASRGLMLERTVKALLELF